MHFTFLRLSPFIVFGDESSLTPEAVCEDEEKQSCEFVMTMILLPGELRVHQSLRTCGLGYVYFLS